MQYAFLGRTGVKVSRLALGAMTIGGEADAAAAGAIVQRARDAGVNLIDTADVYQEGRSEEILGRLLRGWRDEVVLATKAYYPTGPDRNALGSSRYHLVRAVEASLSRSAQRELFGRSAAGAARVCELSLGRTRCPHHSASRTRAPSRRRGG